MSHDHHAHDDAHAHTHANDPHAARTYVWLGLASILIGVVELLGSRVSGSVSLFADMLHVFSDAGSFFIAAAVEHRVVTARLSDAQKDRESLIGMRWGGVLLLLALLFPLYEAVQRFYHPSPVLGHVTAMVALFGIVANAIQHRYVPHKHTHHGNMQSWHTMSDLLTGLAVLASGVAVWWTGIPLIDPVVSLAIILWIASTTIYMMRYGTREH